MPYIKVDVDKIKVFQQSIYSIRRKVNTISSYFSNISYQIDPTIKNNSEVKYKLQSIESDLINCQKVLLKANTFFGDASLKYINAERYLNATDKASTDAQYTDINEIAETIAEQQGIPVNAIKSIILSGNFSITEVLQSVDNIDANNSFANKIRSIAIEDILNCGSKHWITESLSTQIDSGTNSILNEKEKYYFYKSELEGSVLHGETQLGDNKQSSASYSVLSGSLSSSFGIDISEYEQDNAIGKFLEKEKQIEIPQQRKEYDESKQKNKDEEFYEKNGTIIEVDFENKAEGSILEGKLEGKNDWAQGSVEGKLITGEVHGNVSAGMYVYTKNTDGTLKKVFSPGVSAEVGASASLLDIEAEGRIGLGENDDMLGLYGAGDIEVGNVEAEAKISLNSKEAYVGVSAEANLCKIEGSAGISVLGADIGVTAGVTIGVGAHAEVGYTDGKLKVDIGFSLGIGVELGFEIDVQGTVDAIADACENAWETVKDVGKTVGNAVANFFSKW